jgi:hypothetical protein
MAGAAQQQQGAGSVDAVINSSVAGAMGSMMPVRAPSARMSLSQLSSIGTGGIANAFAASDAAVRQLGRDPDSIARNTSAASVSDTERLREEYSTVSYVTAPFVNPAIDEPGQFALAFLAHRTAADRRPRDVSERQREVIERVLATVQLGQQRAMPRIAGGLHQTYHALTLVSLNYALALASADVDTGPEFMELTPLQAISRIGYLAGPVVTVTGQKQNQLMRRAGVGPHVSSGRSESLLLIGVQGVLFTACFCTAAPLGTRVGLIVRKVSYNQLRQALRQNEVSFEAKVKHPGMALPMPDLLRTQPNFTFWMVVPWWNTRGCRPHPVNDLMFTEPLGRSERKYMAHYIDLGVVTQSPASPTRSAHLTFEEAQFRAATSVTYATQQPAMRVAFPTPTQ